MSTLTKPKKPVGKPGVGRQVSAKPALPLPPAKATTKDWESDICAGKFGEGVDWARVGKAVENRARSSRLRPA